MMLHFPLWKKLLIALVCLWGVAWSAPNLFYSQVEQSNDARAIGGQGDWPAFLPSDLVNLGLDLRGGAHLLVKVSVEDVYAERMDGIWGEALSSLREQRDQIGTIRRLNHGASTLQIRIGNASGMPVALRTVRDLATPVSTLTGAGAMDFTVSQIADDVLEVELSDAEKLSTNDRTMQQSLEIVRRRVDETGTREPSIQRQGDDRILIQVPGIGSAEELLALIGKTAKLTFHTVLSRTADPATPLRTDQILLPDVDGSGVYYVLERRAILSGDNLTDAQASFDQNGRPAVAFRMDTTGGRIFGQYTAENIGTLFAIVLDNEVISAPQIQGHIPGGSGQITGNFTVAEANNLSILLRAGALPAEITVLEQRTIGPELGADSIAAGKIAAIIAFGAVMVFMFATYGSFGLMANVALILNVALIFALLSLIGATLTLPGIAGIVLTIGMAVDANVLIFERIREELRSGTRPARAIETGYEKAFSAIVDANITTMIAAVILFMVGSGPVRGFSVTLGLGILTSVFTAIWVTRLFVATWFAARKPKNLTV